MLEKAPGIVVSTIDSIEMYSVEVVLIWSTIKIFLILTWKRVRTNENLVSKRGFLKFFSQDSVSKVGEEGFELIGISIMRVKPWCSVKYQNLFYP